MKSNNVWKYAFYVLVHPFDGFWDLKWEKRGRLKVSLTILFLSILTFITQRRYTGFVINTFRSSNSNVFLEIMGVLLVFILWCTANWCLTSLMDGKGTYRDIAIATGYALMPYVLLNLPMVFLSHFMVLEEMTFYYLVISISLLWCGCLLLSGTMMTHDYSASKTIGTIICILVAMLVLLFLGILLFSIIQKIVSLIYAIYLEIAYRI